LAGGKEKEEFVSLLLGKKDRTSPGFLSVPAQRLFDGGGGKEELPEERERKRKRKETMIVPCYPAIEEKLTTSCIRSHHRVTLLSSGGWGGYRC